MKAFLIVVALFWACALQAQMDVIVLKNGSEIRGVIVEKTEKKIKLTTKDGSIWVFNVEEVEEIKSFSPVPPKSGYYGSVSLGLLGGSATTGNLSIVNGYRISPHWSAGIGVGIEGFYGRMYIPLFFESKFNILKKGSSPILKLGLGYDLPFEFSDNSRGGFFGQGLAGYQHSLGQHFAILAGVGFRYGRIQVENWNWWGGNSSSTETIYEINRFDLRFGFIFR